MAKCEYCGREMLVADGCAYSHLTLRDSRKVRRQKVGEEGWIEPGERCGDCGALYGHYHHPGCDIERCPICGMQALMCECPIEFYAVG